MNIQTYLEQLQHDDESTRIYAAEDLGFANAAEAVAPLIAQSRTDPSRKVRATYWS